MKELIQLLATSLVEHPDQVRVTEEDKGDETVYLVHVAEDDMGRVIGKQGRVAKAIRTVARAAAVKHGKRVQVEIADE